MMETTRFTCTVQLVDSTLIKLLEYNPILNSLLWFEKLIVPQQILYHNLAFRKMHGLIEDDKLFRKLRDADLITTDEELIKKGLLKMSGIYAGADPRDEENASIADHDGGWNVIYWENKREGELYTPSQFSYYLKLGGVEAPPIYQLESHFSNDYKEGNDPCLGILLQKLPNINFRKTRFRRFFDFVTDEYTKVLRRRLFNWKNEIDSKNVKPNELADLIATRLDDYNTWIKSAKLKFELSTFEQVLVTSSEFVEGMIRLRPSKAVQALINLRRRGVNLKFEELKAPGRELALICHAQERFRESNITKVWANLKSKLQV